MDFIAHRIYSCFARPLLPTTEKRERERERKDLVDRLADQSDHIHLVDIMGLVSKCKVTKEDSPVQDMKN